MRRVVWILPCPVLILLTGGCSLFREVQVSRQDSLHTESLKQSLNWKVDSVGSASRMFSFTDSSGSQFDVEIVPSGPFTFSVQAGFAGTASLLRMRGKEQTNIRSTDSATQKTQVRSSGSLEQKVKTKTSIKDARKEKVPNNNLWALFALLLACLIVIVSYSKRCSSPCLESRI